MSELPLSLKLKLMAGVMPGEDGLARRIVEYVHDPRRMAWDDPRHPRHNPSLPMRMLLHQFGREDVCHWYTQGEYLPEWMRFGGMDVFRQYMQARAGIDVPVQDLLRRRDIHHELILRWANLTLQPDGSYWCGTCGMYLSGRQHGVDHVVGMRHRRNMLIIVSPRESRIEVSGQRELQPLW